MQREGPGLTGKQRAELQALEELSDDRIDTSDIPEVLDWTDARRGLFHDLARLQLPLRQHAKECEEKDDQRTGRDTART